MIDKWKAYKEAVEANIKAHKKQTGKRQEQLNQNFGQIIQATIAHFKKEG